MNKKILLTGGTGYIGSHTAVELLNAGYEVILLDNLCNSDKAVVDKIFNITGKKPRFYEADIRDEKSLERIFKKEQPDAVIHFAGLKAVAESVANPLDYYENNVAGTINLLKVMKSASVKKLIFSSSATVYGQQSTPKLDETMTTGVNLTNPYGETKHIIEEMLMDLSESDPSFEITILRYFNPIGAHHSGEIGETPAGIPGNLLPFIMKVHSGEIAELKIFGSDYPTPDGAAIRDYLHVVDLAKGHLAALENIKPGVSIYNLGTGRGSSVLQIVDLFEKVSGKPLPKSTHPPRPGDLPEVFSDAAKAKAELSWQAELSIEEAIADALRFLENSR
jgi:UDP-glucose 4-epimerase